MFPVGFAGRQATLRGSLQVRDISLPRLNPMDGIVPSDLTIACCDLSARPIMAHPSFIPVESAHANASTSFHGGIVSPESYRPIANSALGALFIFLTFRRLTVQTAY